MKQASIEIELGFSNLQPIENTGFVRARCKIAYAGKNRNYSNISEEAFQKAEKTLYGCPVVGNWLEEIGNFGGHDKAMETRGNKLVMKDTTTPYGFVPQDANVSWEDVEDKYGNITKYYCSDVILWQERYPEQIEFIADNGINQSMEIMVIDGDWDDNYDYFDINDFRFVGLCLLGRDRDGGSKGQNDVEPCFEQSEVVFGLSDELSAELNDMKMAYQSIGKEDVDMKKDFEEVEETEVETKTEVEEVADEKVEDEVEEIAEESSKADDSDLVGELSSKLESLSNEFNELKAENEKLLSELESLKEFKSDVEAQEIKAKKEAIVSDYSALLSKEEIESVDVDAFDVEDLKAKFSCMYAEKSLSQVKSTKFEKKEDVIICDNKSNNKEFKKNEFAI